MNKRKKNSKKNQSNILKIIAWILAIIVLLMSSMAIGYFVGFENAKKDIEKKEKRKEDRRLALLKRIESTSSVKTSQNPSVNTRLKKVLKKEESHKKDVLKVKSYAGASHEYASEPLAKPPLRIKRTEKKIHASKPKLAIIIDDVSVKSQVKAIKSLGLNITMSFLPPSKARPNSAKLAAKENFYMVHLPMEAQSYSAEEPNTLRVMNSQAEIFTYVKNIKKLFPKVRYINNHTGSKYTANETAMNKLIVAMNKNNISFIDSRTTSKTKVPLVMKNFGLKYVARDVFLDHHTDKAYVKKQIKDAIRIAKSEGIAIAIGHPHSNTILALHESKKLFKDVDLVLINKVY